MSARDSHCGWCGCPFRPEAAWPRLCAACGRKTYQNPLPVALLLVPVDGRLLVVRRAKGTGRGQLALPGGFIECGETWQEAAARELFEETGVRVAAASVRLFDARSTERFLLIFGLAPPQSELPPFVRCEECSARELLDGPRPLAFPAHTEVVERWFGG